MVKEARLESDTFNCNTAAEFDGAFRAILHNFFN